MRNFSLNACSDLTSLVTGAPSQRPPIAALPSVSASPPTRGRRGSGLNCCPPFLTLPHSFLEAGGHGLGSALPPCPHPAANLPLGPAPANPSLAQSGSSTTIPWFALSPVHCSIHCSGRGDPQGSSDLPAQFLLHSLDSLQSFPGKLRPPPSLPAGRPRGTRSRLWPLAAPDHSLFHLLIYYHVDLLI